MTTPHDHLTAGPHRAVTKTLGEPTELMKPKKECAGSTCCGTSCETVHNAGFGATYNDCVASGTYDSTQAFKACEAEDGVGNCAVQDCSGTPVVCSSSAMNCRCWMYSGAAAGSANDAGGMACGCCTSACGVPWD